MVNRQTWVGWAVALKRPGRTWRWLWGLAALPIILLLSTVGYIAWSLYDPVTRMPPAEALPLTLSAGDRNGLLDLYSPDPVKRATAANLAVELSLKHPEMADRLVPFMVGLLGDCELPGQPKPAFSVAYLKSLWTPPDLVMLSLDYDANVCFRPDNAAMYTLASMGKPAVEPLIRVLGESKRTMARFNAARALGYIDDPKAEAAVLAALKDRTWEVRAGAVAYWGHLLGTYWGHNTIFSPWAGGRACPEPGRGPAATPASPGRPRPPADAPSACGDAGGRAAPRLPGYCGYWGHNTSDWILGTQYYFPLDGRTAKG